MIEAFRQQIIDHIAKFGVSIVGVGGDAATKSPPFAYTIGLTAKFGFEIIVFGLPMEHAHVILNDVAAQGVDLDVPTDKFTNLPLLFKECDVNLGRLHDQFVVQADNFYGKEVTVVQMILSDRQGRTPLDDTFDHEYMGKFQPLFADFTKR